jgi:hypothetical protein
MKILPIHVYDKEKEWKNILFAPIQYITYHKHGLTRSATFYKAKLQISKVFMPIRIRLFFMSIRIFP